VAAKKYIKGMSYITSTKINGRFIAGGYGTLQKAFEQCGAQLDSPSKDGYFRRILQPGKKPIVFTSDALPLNSAAAQSLARDKLATYQLLEEQKIKIPKGTAVFARKFHGRETHVEKFLLIDNLKDSVRELFPQVEGQGCKVICKPGRESQSFLVKVCTSVAGVERHMRKILQIGHYGFVQEYVRTPEYRLVLLDDQILFCYLKPPRELEEEGKTKKKKHHKKPMLIPLKNVSIDVKRIAQAAHSATGLRYSGVDVCLPRGKAPVILEVNSNPGLDFIEKYHKTLARTVANKVVRSILG
jgi:glutathione synthase/RimK-type ligase-like ATP-grasp enzyme